MQFPRDYREYSIMLNKCVSPLLFAVALFFVMPGCGSDDAEEAAPSSEHAAAHEALTGSEEADVDLDDEGNIIGVMFSDTPTDAQLQAVAGLATLTDLSFEGETSDDIIPHLKGLTSLKSLELGEDSKISRSGLAELSNALPGCSISAAEQTIGGPAGSDDGSDEDE
jgi:hypothetical protein